jgi:hypothetical protein
MEYQMPSKVNKQEEATIKLREVMHDKLKVIHNRVDEILGQVKITNSRVSKLESWKDQMMGGLKVSSVIAVLLAFLFKMGWVGLQ